MPIILGWLAGDATSMVLAYKNLCVEDCLMTSCYSVTSKSSNQTRKTEDKMA